MGFPVHVLSNYMPPRLWLIADVAPRVPYTLAYVHNVRFRRVVVCSFFCFSNVSKR